MIVWLDTETGGLQPGHPTIQVAAIATGPDGREVDAFEAKIAFREQDADSESLKLNHYDPAVWTREAKFEQHVVRDFKAWLDRYRSIECVSKRTGNTYTVARVGGHSIVGFDLPRIARLFKRWGEFFPVQYNTALDTLQGAAWYFERNPPGGPLPDYKLATLAAYFGIETTGAHDALADCRMSAAIARRLLA